MVEGFKTQAAAKYPQSKIVGSTMNREIYNQNTLILKQNIKFIIKEIH